MMRSADFQHLSKFNTRVLREVFIFGSERFVAEMQRVLEVVGFLRVYSHLTYTPPRPDMYFFIADADFTDHASLQDTIREFSKHDPSQCQRILYSSQRAGLTPEEIFFGAELNASLIVAGPNRDHDLRQFIKRLSMQAEQIGSIEHYESEIAKLSAKSDMQALKQIDDKLAVVDKDMEAVVRLRALIAQRTGRLKVYEGFLKRMLQINPQNLWAANELGKYYIQLQRPAEGIEVLEKLSAFHALNGERLLMLGETYLNVGASAKAETVLKQGVEMSSGQDQRFLIGLAKSQAIQGRHDEALDLFEDKKLPEPVVSYLNTRAILAIRAQRFDEGIQLYREALERGPADPLVRAKLHFNFGLAYVRARRLSHAIKEFELSLKEGKQFGYDRAQKPLNLVRQILGYDETELFTGDAKKIPDEDNAAFEFDDFSRGRSGK